MTTPITEHSLSTLDRYRGALLGLACGDAVGTTVEFSARGSFKPVTDMVGGGPFSLPAGYWTDDTSMALCLATSLIERGEFDPRDQMERYVNWWQHGYLSPTGRCFDIGITVCQALQRYLATQNPLAGDTDPMTAGNGSLMRLAPVVLRYAPDLDTVRHYAQQSSLTTHGAPEAVESCALYGELLVRALAGQDKASILDVSTYPFESPAVAALARGEYRHKSIDQIKGSGYCIASLEAALWCFDHTDTFEQAVLTATNLGDDADTTAAIVGQIAGAFYGVQGIPTTWLNRVYMRDDMLEMAQQLLTLAQERPARV